MSLHREIVVHRGQWSGVEVYIAFKVVWPSRKAQEIEASEAKLVKKILLQLDTDRFPSVFDTIAAYDGGADLVLQYGGVEPGDVRDLVYGAEFTRGVDDLRNTAIFIGGTDVARGEALLHEARDAAVGQLRVSMMLDSNGCNTTAVAVVMRVLSCGNVEDASVVVLAGTGSVGRRVAGLLAREGARVTLTSRGLERAAEAAGAVEKRFGISLSFAATPDDGAVADVLEGASFVVCTGATGVALVPEALWKDHPTLRALADVNAVPPLGIAGSVSTWDGERVDEKKVYGALGIGEHKMQAHRHCIARLFEQNDLVLDAEEILAAAKDLECSRS